MRYFLALILTAVSFLPLWAQERPAIQANTVYVGADGKYESAPDTVVVTFNIAAQEATSKEAYDRASRAAEQIRQLLKANGLDPKSAQIGGLAVSPVVDWKSAKRRIVGYQVYSDVTIKFKDFGKVDGMVQGLTDLDVTANQSLSYTLEDMDAAKAKAIEDAYRRAREAAAVLTRAAGRTLGELLYGTVDTFEAAPAPRVMMAAGVIGENGNERTYG